MRTFKLKGELDFVIQERKILTDPMINSFLERIVEISNWSSFNVKSETVGELNSEIRSGVGYIEIAHGPEKNSLRKRFVRLNMYLIKPAFLMSPMSSLQANLFAYSNEIKNGLASIENEPFGLFQLEKFVRNCKSLLNGLKELNGILTILADTLKVDEYSWLGSKEDSSLVIGIDNSDRGVRSIGVKIDSIVNAYELVCEIFDVDSKEYPLTAGDLEVGSLWSKVFGHSKVIEFMSWFMKNSVKFMHRAYTEEGKIEAIPKKIELLEKHFEFSAKVKELLGEDEFSARFKENNDLLTKCMVQLSKNTSKLLAGQAKVTIDDEDFEIKGRDQMKYLMASQQLLESGNSEAEDLAALKAKMFNQG